MIRFSCLSGIFWENFKGLEKKEKEQISPGVEREDLGMMKKNLEKMGNKAGQGKNGTGRRQEPAGTRESMGQRVFNPS